MPKKFNDYELLLEHQLMKFNTISYALAVITVALIMPSLACSSSSLISVNKERKIFLNCQGKGSPTVIFIAGFPNRGDAAFETLPPGSNKAAVFSQVSKFTKVCDYDRPGTIKVLENTFLKSRSDPVLQPVSATDQVKDLQALVKSAHIKKPFIIVAHSAGGLIARLYAYQHPDDVAGLVLIDVTHEYFFREFSKNERYIFNYLLTKSFKELTAVYKEAEIIDFDKSFEQLNHYNKRKLNLPAIILTADKKPDFQTMKKGHYWPEFVTQEMVESFFKAIDRANVILSKTFQPEAKILKVNSEHYIQHEKPELIIKVIQEMVKQNHKS